MEDFLNAAFAVAGQFIVPQKTTYQILHAMNLDTKVFFLVFWSASLILLGGFAYWALKKPIDDYKNSYPFLFLLLIFSCGIFLSQQIPSMFESFKRQMPSFFVMGFVASKLTVALGGFLLGLWAGQYPWIFVPAAITGYAIAVFVNMMGRHTALLPVSIVLLSWLATFRWVSKALSDPDVVRLPGLLGSFSLLVCGWKLTEPPFSSPVLAAAHSDYWLSVASYGVSPLFVTIGFVLMFSLYADYWFDSIKHRFLK